MLIKLLKYKMKQKNKYKFQAVFLDRDGTINYDSGYTHKFSNFKFRPKVIEGLKFLTSKFFHILLNRHDSGLLWKIGYKKLS